LQFEFSDSDDGYPLVRRATQTLYTEGALSWSQQETFEVKQWLYRTLPEEEFRAESYEGPRAKP
jgi:hypothetical protein